MIENYTNYNSEMNKSISDKLFFMNLLDFKEDIKCILDYGCADGSLLRALSRKLPVDYPLIGYDIDEEMILKARELSESNIEYVSNLKNISSPTDDIAIVMSSVWHEMFSYLTNSQIVSDMKELIECVNPKYIIIRDMCVTSSTYEWAYNTLLLKAINISKDENHITVRNAISNDGILKTREDVATFIFKYRFVNSGNWHKEKDENYLCANPYRVTASILEAGFSYLKILMTEHKLDFIDLETMKTFNCHYPYMTHYHMILKRS